MANRTVKTQVIVLVEEKAARRLCHLPVDPLKLTAGPWRLVVKTDMGKRDKRGKATKGLVVYFFSVLTASLYISHGHLLGPRALRWEPTPGSAR